MESINSTEKVTTPTVGAGEPPSHTAEDHRACAYYPGFKPECSHGVAAEGAFYNEDHVNEIRRTAHQLIASLLASNYRFTNNESRLIHDLRRLTK